MWRLLVVFLILIAVSCTQSPDSSVVEAPERATRRLEGETLIVEGRDGLTPLGVRIEGLLPTPATPSVLNLAVSTSQLPLAGFGALTCFQATDHPRERTQVCMGFRHDEDVTEEQSQPRLFFFRIERVEGRDRPHVLFSAGQDGLTVYRDNGAWWNGEVWDLEGNTIDTDHTLEPVARIGNDGIIRARGFEVVDDLAGACR